MHQEESFNRMVRFESNQTANWFQINKYRALRCSLMDLIKATNLLRAVLECVERVERFIIRQRRGDKRMPNELLTVIVEPFELFVVNYSQYLSVIWRRSLVSPTIVPWKVRNYLLFQWFVNVLFAPIIANGAHARQTRQKNQRNFFVLRLNE